MSRELELKQQKHADILLPFAGFVEQSDLVTTLGQFSRKTRLEL